MMTLHAYRLAIFILFLFSLLPVSAQAEDNYSIEFMVKEGDNLYKICEKILEDPEDWRW
jgi:hypothetical protein